jgi:hypothetical protein
MANDNSSAKISERGNVSDQTGQGSQDAVRHQKDALHHKFHKSPPSAADEKNGQKSQARAQQDSVDIQQSEGLQPEIPKVGSRDARGG